MQSSLVIELDEVEKLLRARPDVGSVMQPLYLHPVGIVTLSEIDVAVAVAVVTVVEDFARDVVEDATVVVVAIPSV